MEAKLLIVGGKVTSGEFRLELPTVIGRGRDADLRLAHPLVSRKHCEITEKDGLLQVRDLGSLNGTFIADDRISEATLRPDELLSVGPVILRAIYTVDADDAESEPQQTDFEAKAGAAALISGKKTACLTETLVPLNDEETGSLDASSGDDSSNGDSSIDVAQTTRTPEKSVAPDESEVGDDDDELNDFFKEMGIK